jgi:SAM-dependent methyltransferase
VNRLHNWLCRSEGWRKTVEERLPWALGDVELGPNVLELGPGPGFTTDLLRHRLARLTAIEIDPKLAASLSERLQDSNVRVVKGDATAMPFANAEFSGAVSFTMMHHVRSPALQDQLLRETWRVIRPGGLFVGADSRFGKQSKRRLFLRVIHIGDTMVPVDPDTFGARLEAAGFEAVEIEKNPYAFRFRAQRPEVRP